MSPDLQIAQSRIEQLQSDLLQVQSHIRRLSARIDEVKARNSFADPRIASALEEIWWLLFSVVFLGVVAYGLGLIG
jgi:predicted  nucleic acid-binding Zn-ribbon protein